jgi:PadR family transcriptional regulator, regulatory protein PadR
MSARSTNPETDLCRIGYVKNTKALRRVAKVLLKDPKGRHYGYSLSKAADVKSGVLYPLLTRLLAEGWVTDEWEAHEADDPGRPRRRYYRVTADGVSQLARIVATEPHAATSTSPGIAWTQ